MEKRDVNQDVMDNWQKAVITDAVQKLERDLTERERRYITSTGGFIALEMVHDTIKCGSKEKIESIFNWQP